MSGAVLQALVPSSLAPILLPVVGGAAKPPVSLAAEKLLVKSEIIHFMCFYHHSNQLNYIFKDFPPPPQHLPLLPHLRSPSGVAHLCGGSSGRMGFSGHF